MNSKQFINNIKTEIESQVALYAAGAAGHSQLGTRLDNLKLDSETHQQVIALIEEAIKESTYNLICAFEGSADLAGSQEELTISDEQGNVISGGT